MWNGMVGYYRQRNEHRSLEWAIAKEAEWELIKPKEEEYDDEEDEDEASGDEAAAAGGEEEDEWVDSPERGWFMPSLYLQQDHCSEKIRGRAGSEQKHRAGALGS